MSFRISALPKSLFQHLFHLPAEKLREYRAVRMVADKTPGFPCRISLADAEIGEDLILVHHEYQTADTPFRGSHAVFVRPGAEDARLGVDEVPEMLRSRTLSLRAFDQAGMMAAADLTDGRVLEQAIEGMLENSRVAYLHIHFAKPGCYAARVDRV